MGTNTVLACVVEHDASGVRLVSDRSRITRLGAGVDAAGALADDAIERTLAALEELTREARALGAERAVGVGTSALRDARNRDRFLERARAFVDDFQVIDGAHEAELTFRGAFFGLEAPTRAVTVIDIGGGSTEVVRGASEIESAVSIDVGSVRLTERFGIGEAVPSEAQLAAMRVELARAMRDCAIRGPLAMVAGTATNVAAVALGRDLVAGAHAPHGEVVGAGALREAIERITRASREERRAMIGVQTGRHDVIVAGALIFEHVLDRSGAAEAMISDGGVRFGLAMALL